MSRYAIHAAAIEHDGLRLSEEPRAVTDSASEALRLSGDPSNHGPEGAAIVCWDGRVIYTADEYARFRDEEASSS